MRTKLISIALLFSMAITLAGCTVAEENKGATTGAALGAATGAAAGAALSKSGSRMKGAVIGGLLGALVGGAVGHYAYDTKYTRDQTNTRYKYNPAGTASVRLEDANVVPTSVRPGEKVDMKATYAVLSDNANNEVEITEVREITFNGELVGRPAVTVSHRGGTYTSTIPVYMPNDAKAGTYKVATTILTGNSKDTRETTFRVR